MDRLVEEGLIIVRGPVGTGEHTAHLIESEDPGETALGSPRTRGRRTTT
jgi:hypothetical protein